MDLIYIVEDSVLSESPDDSYVPNFTFPGAQEQPGESYSNLKTGALLAAGVLLPPIGLLASAGSLGYTAYRLISRYSDGGSLDAEARFEAEKINLFAQRHSLTIKQAKNRGYNFQPGHPMVGKSYRIHPLAEYAGANKDSLYILSESYDSVLLEERESELIKLLVDLGATKITITKINSKNSRNSMQGSIGGNATELGEAKVGAGFSSGLDEHGLDAREFTLTGSHWIKGQKVDKSQYYWLPFEASWGALVHSREIGGCLSASLEIKKNTSSSSDKNLEIALKSKLYGVEASAAADEQNDDGSVYKFCVEFAGPSPQASHPA